MTTTTHIQCHITTEGPSKMRQEEEEGGMENGQKHEERGEEEGDDDNEYVIVPGVLDSNKGRRRMVHMLPLIPSLPSLVPAVHGSIDRGGAAYNMYAAPCLLCVPPPFWGGIFFHTSIYRG
jgi:hypothetical protein